MRVVVTGGMGFIGTSVLKKLISHGHEVICVDFVEERIKTYEKYRHPIIEDVYWNLRDCADVMEPGEFLNSNVIASTCVHLGACVDTRGVNKDLFENNIRFTRQLIDSLRPETKVVYASSAAVYGLNGFPCNPYGMTKQLGENLLKGSMSRLYVTCLRFFNVFGSNEHHKGDMASVPFKIAHAYRHRSLFKLFNPDAARDFIPVSTVADAVVGHALESAMPYPSFRIFDVGRGEAVTFNDLDYAMRTVFNRNESYCEEVPQPPEYDGRYQVYTRAGSRNTISPYVKAPTLVDALTEEFNRD